MNNARDLTATLRALEGRLLDPDVRKSPRQVDSLLADEFAEIGSSGQVYDKATAVAELAAEPGFDRPRTIADFTARPLSPSLMLVTYLVPESNTLRSSIWRFGAGAWQLLFHQGTRRTRK